MLEVYAKSGSVSDYSWGKERFDAQKARSASSDFAERGIKSLFSPTGKSFPHVFGHFHGPPAAPCLTFGPTFVTLRPWETHAFGFRLRANAPEGQKRFPISRCKE